MRKSLVRDYDRERAITLICKAVINVDLDVIKKMLCLAVGHPAAVRIKHFGNMACARCGTYMPVSIENWTPGYEDGVLTMGKLTPTDLLLTFSAVTEKVTDVASV